MVGLMFKRIAAWLSRRNQAREAAGYLDGLAMIERYGVDHAINELDWTFGLGFGRTAHITGIERAVSEAKAGQSREPVP
jgi:hypothetical protein